MSTLPALSTKGNCTKTVGVRVFNKTMRLNHPLGLPITMCFMFQAHHHFVSFNAGGAGMGNTMVCLEVQLMQVQTFTILSMPGMFYQHWAAK